MPRTSSPPRSSVKSFPVHKPSKALPPLPPTPYVPPQTSIQPQNSVVQVPASQGLLDSVKQGFGWGVGTSIARSFFEPTKSSTPPLTQAQPPQANKCQELENSFNSCVKGAPYDIQTCQPQLDSWNTCLKNA